MTNRQRMNIVIVGHVDHGKSTVIGRLLADTGTLPQGKLEFVREMCRKNAKPFEYAFLLDALKDEQAQGITIDTARCFFKTRKRDYIIIDAPGHIEFLKNMITGAARAEAALLVIDAQEGIQENSKRHGHLVSMLGIKQVTVLVNKMDLVAYDKNVFGSRQSAYTDFLKQLNVVPVSFIPISAREGENITVLSGRMKWYKGHTLLEQLDEFEPEKILADKPFRFPVQDVYKFTQNNDDRRIIAGTVAAGSIKPGEEVVFLPSRKRAVIKTVEAFNEPPKLSAHAGDATGFTMATQVYVRPGELVVAATDPAPQVGSRFKANIFWMGRAPLIKNKVYKLKLAATRTTVRLVEITQTIDSSDLSIQEKKNQLDRHDVAECVLETAKPIVFDTAHDCETTGRFVIIDNYEIAGGGIILEASSVEGSILEEHIRQRENIWEKGLITSFRRSTKNGHQAKFIIFSGAVGVGKRAIAKKLEEELFAHYSNVYYLGIANIDRGLDADITGSRDNLEERIRRLGELARIMTDAGLIFITTIDNADDYDLEALKLLNEPNEIVVINVGENELSHFQVDLALPASVDPSRAVEQVIKMLKSKEVILEYYL
ncbi:MAG: GTP-binding protein [Elusimicrobia bacterium]|nr:GTP-binding protein [Elusimicrobiota bacterium]